MTVAACGASAQDSAPDRFAAGVQAYRAGDFSGAANSFRIAALQNPASGTLLNLGNAEWQLKQTGLAILAWEQVLWLNPFEERARNNLQFARDTAQLESPDLRWYEVASAWLPPSAWAWLTGASLWTAVAALVIPSVLRRRKTAWHQAIAALGLGIFLLCIPAHAGSSTRSNLGFVLQSETPLRLTPTTRGETVTSLNAGDPVRRLRSRGNYVFVRSSRATGWLSTSEVGFLASLRPHHSPDRHHRPDISGAE